MKGFPVTKFCKIMTKRRFIFVPTTEHPMESVEGKRKFFIPWCTFFLILEIFKWGSKVHLSLLSMVRK